MNDVLMHLSYSEVVAVLNEQAARIAELEAQIAKMQISLRAAHEENMALIDELDGDEEA